MHGATMKIVNNYFEIYKEITRCLFPLVFLNKELFNNRKQLCFWTKCLVLSTEKVYVSYFSVNAK